MRHTGLGPYDLGYAEGRQSVRLATSSYARRIGYEPTILRAAESGTKGEKTLPVRSLMGPPEGIFRSLMGPPLRSIKGPPAREA